MANKDTGAIIYQGPSMLDGAPIVAIATGLDNASANPKTGAMAQVWIMRDDVGPVAAVKSGADESICGDCPHRPVNGGACYVRVFQAPRSVYAAYQRGRYPTVRLNALGALFAGRKVRMGAYGDPAAVPLQVWQEITATAATYTGYSHQWRALGAPWASFLMASVDSPQEAEQARAAGWRSFRIHTEEQALFPWEITCPASEEAGHLTDCSRCGLCGGAAVKARSIAILPHGSTRAAFVA